MPKPGDFVRVSGLRGPNGDVQATLVEKIKPAVRSTRRPGADGEIGGFGGLFDLKAAGFKDPVLVAANDGVGTKLKVAELCGAYEAIGVDAVAMNTNDVLVYGAAPLLFHGGRFYTEHPL